MSQHTPTSLPASPAGWTRKMGMHMSFGDGGAACYSIHDPDGNDTGIVYQYDTRPDPEMVTGYHYPAVDSDVYPSWAKLAEAWPSLIQAAGKEGA